MRRIHKPIIVFISLFVFTSCVRVETVIRVNKDGSGTITETLLMYKVFADMMRSFSESFGDLGVDEVEKKEFSLFDEEKLTRQATGFGEGVKYQSGSKVTKDEWEGYSAVYSFSDISKIKLNTSQEDKVDTGMGPAGREPEFESSQQQNEFYYFTFDRGKTPLLTINRTEIEDQNGNMNETKHEDGEVDVNAMNSEMLDMFKGMRFTMKVEVDGKITKTNASYRNGKSAITLMDMDMGEMMKNKEAFSVLSKTKPRTTEELKSFMDQFDGLELELEQPVTIHFR